MAKSKMAFKRVHKFDEIFRDNEVVLFYYKGKHIFTINNQTKVLYY